LLRFLLSLAKYFKCPRTTIDSALILSCSNSFQAISASFKSSAAAAAFTVAWQNITILTILLGVFIFIWWNHCSSKYCYTLKRSDICTTNIRQFWWQPLFSCDWTCENERGLFQKLSKSGYTNIISLHGRFFWEKNIHVRVIQVILCLKREIIVKISDWK